MTWYAWVAVGWLAFAGLVTVYAVGRPREPIAPSTAVVSVLITGLLIWAIVSLATR